MNSSVCSASRINSVASKPRTLDSETGTTAGVLITAVKAGDPSVNQFYDLATGKVKRDERYDWLMAGGRAAGGDTESWLRMRVRTYNPATGELKSEEVLRLATTPEGSKYLPVNK